MAFKFGIDQVLASPKMLSELKRKKCALVAHPASITSDMQHSLDALIDKQCNIVCAFGPQHGMRGDKQDNMIETSDYLDPAHNLPIISLYGEHRRPTAEMLEGIDIVLFDLQDIGCRIYTYLTTLAYFVDACAEYNIELWILDRPNPAGRPIDGLRLEVGNESFVGCAAIPMRHGLTLGEFANWYKQKQRLKCPLRVILMQYYQPTIGPNYGWPALKPWINPSPNANTVNMARCFSGTVLLEGTTLSEGRGTTIPLEVLGAPDLPIKDMLELIETQLPNCLKGIYIRPCYFEPTFHKFKGEMCTGIQIHTDFESYQDQQFTPYLFIAACLKALRILQPERDIWRTHYYEYESKRLPIDVINGGESLRDWVDDSTISFQVLAEKIVAERKIWQQEISPFLLY